MGNRQGTEWESDIVRESESRGFKADRLRQRGIAGEPDLFIGQHPKTAVNYFPALMWKRLVKKGGARRVPDGVRAVVVMDVNDWFDILEEIDAIDPEWMERTSIVVQAKWTERLNVTRVLADLITACKAWLD